MKILVSTVNKYTHKTSERFTYAFSTGCFLYFNLSHIGLIFGMAFYIDIIQKTFIGWDLKPAAIKDKSLTVGLG